MSSPEPVYIDSVAPLTAPRRELRKGVTSLRVSGRGLRKSIISLGGSRRGLKRIAEPSERAMYALWQRADALVDGMATEDGRRFWVIYPGRANPRAGPDFHDAIIQTEAGERITGDVEFHLRAPDWHAHGHDSDANYNAVILHVVRSPKGQAESERQSGLRTPVASMADAVHLLVEATGALPDALADVGYADGSGLNEALDRAGDERFLARSRGFAHELAKTSPDQVVYGGFMEALDTRPTGSPSGSSANGSPSPWRS